MFPSECDNPEREGSPTGACHEQHDRTAADELAGRRDVSAGLSPNDSHEEIAEMVSSYLGAGIVVWVIDPDLRTVTVYRPTGEVKTLSARQELDGEDYLPGFKESVARLFG